MTSFDRFENRLPVVLDELSTPRLPDYADDLFARTAATRQRPVWTFPERWFPMSAVARRFAAVPRIPWRLGVLVALLLIVAMIGLLVAGSSRSHPAPPFGPAANGGIAYVSAGDIYVGDPATGTSRLLIGGSENDRFPVFSLDGTRVLFARDVPGTGDLKIDLYAVDADGSNLRKLTAAPLTDADVLAVSWAADGRHIGVIHKVDGINQLELLDAKGNGAVQQLSAAAGLDSFAFRPPTGGQIMFRVGGTPGDAHRGLWVMDADGSNARLLLAEAGTSDSLDLTDATYAPDGATIYFNHWTDDASAGDPGCCQLYAINADGSNLRELLANPGTAWDGSPAISPDGTRIALWHSVNNGGDSGIFVVKADGVGPMVKTGPPIEHCCWSWTPDSAAILMFPAGGSGGNAYLLDPAGGPWKTVSWKSTEDISMQRLAPAN